MMQPTEVVSEKTEFIESQVKVLLTVHDIHQFMFEEDWEKRG